MQSSSYKNIIGLKMGDIDIKKVVIQLYGDSEIYLFIF
jgi:hypothetical protein